MNKSHYFRISHFLYALGFVLLIATEGIAQMTLIVIGGNQNMTINTGIADGDLINVVNINSSLEYDTGAKLRKITVRTSCAGQSFNLSVIATTVTEGVAAPAVPLINGNPARDFITNIAKKQKNETCTLQYTASATFAQGNSNDVGVDIHLVTYTIQTQ
jgi:hypothetical protein